MRSHEEIGKRLDLETTDIGKLILVGGLVMTEDELKQQLKELAAIGIEGVRVNTPLYSMFEDAFRPLAWVLGAENTDTEKSEAKIISICESVNVTI